MLSQSLRPLFPLIASVALALPMLGTATPASAICANPSGNCPNGGLVTFPTPVPVPTPSPLCADPSGTCGPPPGGQTNRPSPNPNGNTDAGPPVAPGLSVQVSPSTAGPGDTVAVVGQGFSANGRGNLIFINLVDANGVTRDTNYKPITCVNTDDWVLTLYQNLGWGCSGDAAGPLLSSTGTGGFTGAFTVPADVALGPGKVCIASVFSNPVCAPILLQAGAPTAPSDSSSTDQPDDTGDDAS